MSEKTLENWDSPANKEFINSHTGRIPKHEIEGLSPDEYALEMVNVMYDAIGEWGAEWKDFDLETLITWMTAGFRNSDYGWYLKDCTQPEVVRQGIIDLGIKVPWNG